MPTMNRIKNFLKTLNRKTDFLFPEQKIFKREFPLWQEGLIFAFLLGFGSLLGSFLPADGFIGFDWVNFWSIGRVAPFHPPWTELLVRPLTWPLLVGLTLSAFSLAVLKRAVHPVSAAMAVICLPLLWTVFLGQLEGMVILGLLGLPYLAPLALVKPQVSFFAFGARRQYIYAFFTLIAISLVLWGPWPLRTLAVESYYGEGRYPQNIGLGWWGLPAAVALLWLSRGDMDMLMLGGIFAIPHLIPYNLLPALPAVSRLSPKAAVVAFVLSWLPFSANYIGPMGWWLGWLFVIWVWLNLAARRYADRPLAAAFLRWWG